MNLLITQGDIESLIHSNTLLVYVEQIGNEALTIQKEMEKAALKDN